jgi:hypothetical protein
MKQAANKGCNAVQFGESPKFQVFSELRGITTQKTAPFIVISARTSNPTK